MSSRNEEVENHRSEDRVPVLLFWKKNTKPVPGRPRARKEIRSNCHPNPSSSFQYFQESVNDAWEIADNEFSSKQGKQIPKQTIHSTVLTVSNLCGTALSSESSVERNFRSRSENYKNDRVNIGVREEPIKVHRSTTSSITTQHYQTILSVAIGSDSETMVGKLAKFQRLLESNLLSLDDLRQFSWSGIPEEVRPIIWRLLAGYLPVSLERREAAMERKRLDYWNQVRQYFDTESDGPFQDTYRQIHIDIPRMSPLIPLFKQKTVQKAFERILFIWAIRHPASGYVQGINDLVTPFYVVFLQEFLPAGSDIDTFEVSSLPKEHQDIIEADSFWCLSKFLEGIQDNYIFAQLGIQHKVNQLKELIQRIDSTLHKHIQSHNIDYLQFSFRWMNNLLTREIPLCCCMRLWDTYLAESDSFASFHLYVCAAFLLHWRRELLLQQDFQGVMLTLQNFPTHNWVEADIEVIVAEAYRLKFTFADTPNHLQNSDKQ